MPTKTESLTKEVSDEASLERDASARETAEEVYQKYRRYFSPQEGRRSQMMGVDTYNTNLHKALREVATLTVQKAITQAKGLERERIMKLAEELVQSQKAEAMSYLLQELKQEESQ